MDILLNNLYLIKPEIALSIALAVIVTVDLIMHNNKKFLPYVALVGIAVGIIFVIEQFGFSTAVMQANQKLIAVDPFGAFFKILILFTSALIIVFSIISKEVKESFERHGEYYALIFGMVIGMMFMVSSADLILIYLSLELVSLSSYVLSGFTKTSHRNSEASLKYVIYGSVSSGLMLFGISLLFGLTGTTNLYAINAFIVNSLGAGMLYSNFAFMLAGILVFVGIGYKISAAPFHFWTPDVYEGAPITITAYLSIASKAAGFALLIRFIKITFVNNVDANGFWSVIPVIDWQFFLIIISILTMTLGNFAALWQSNMKRLLAYSSIAHAGYLLLGLIVMSDQGITAIMVYFLVYAFMNLGAFLVVMLIANKIKSEELDDYKGLGYSAPFLSICLGIFLVSLTGLPPTAGFIGKLYIFIALVDAKMITVAVIALLNTVVSLYYYIRVLKNMFIDKPEVEPTMWKMSPAYIVLVLLLAVPTLILGIYFGPLVEFAKNSVAMLNF